MSNVQSTPRRNASLAGALAITVVGPTALLIAGEYFHLPGIPSDLADLAGRGGGSVANLGVFALGVMPILTAYWIV